MGASRASIIGHKVPFWAPKLIPNGVQSEIRAETVSLKIELSLQREPFRSLAGGSRSEPFRDILSIGMLFHSKPERCRAAHEAPVAVRTTCNQVLIIEVQYNLGLTFCPKALPNRPKVRKSPLESAQVSPNQLGLQVTLEGLETVGPAAGRLPVGPHFIGVPRCGGLLFYQWVRRELLNRPLPLARLQNLGVRQVALFTQDRRFECRRHWHMFLQIEFRTLAATS